MNSSEPWAILAFLLIFSVGLPYAQWLGMRGLMLPAAGWLLGSGVVAGSMLVLSALHVSYGRGSLAIAWTGAMVLGCALCRRSMASRQPPVRARAIHALFAEPIVLIMIGICLFQVVYTLLVAVRIPLGSFDSWALWDYKGLRFWHDGGIRRSFLTDSATVFAHPAYPPLVPLLIAWVYTWCGQSDPVLMKPLFPLFYVALLIMFGAAVAVPARWRLGLLGASCLSLIPRVADYAGTGLADVPLSAFVLAASASFALAVRTPDSRRGYAAAGVFLGLACLVKHDGLVFLVTALVVVAALRVTPRRSALLFVPALLVALPWYVYVAAIQAPDRDFISTTPAHLSANAWRIPEIARLFTLNMLSLTEWSVLWFAVAVLAVRGLMRRDLRLPILLVPVVLPLCIYIVSLSLSAWPDYLQHARTSLDRLILVTAPFGLWFALAQWNLGDQRPRGQAVGVHSDSD